MRILLTNDDGIRAPGIEALFEALTDAEGVFGGPLRDPAGERGAESVVWPIAPLTVQSATSHGVTFHTPLMVTPVRVSERMQGHAVDARPADCVKLAIANLWPERFGAGSRPDLVISGMNMGANCGINVIYSGTVAAALEAAFMGVPAIAVSLHMGTGRANYKAAARHARTAIERVIAGGLPTPHECLNINVPITEEEGPMPPVRVGPMNVHGLTDAYERRVSPDGKPYYWATGHGLDFRGMDRGSDVDYLFQRCITVTPLKYDLTDHLALDRWRGRVGSPES